MTLGAVNQTALASPSEDETRKPTDDQPVPIADPVPAGFRSWDELWAVQEELTEAADRITAAAQTRVAAGSGLGSIVVETEQREIRVYWKGTLPAPVQDAVNSLGTDVRVLSASYTADELQQAADRIRADGSANADATGPVVSAVGPLADASGLRVSVDGPAEAAFDVPAVRDAGVAISVERDVDTRPASRADESAPYFGGAVQFAAGRGNCTSGFAITHAGWTTMLTAGHCAFGAIGASVFDGGAFTTGTSQNQMGSISTSKLLGKKVGVCCFGNYVWEGLDLVAISMTATAAAHVYAGPLGDGNTVDPVVGLSSNYVGQFVCTSGAPSGRRCNLKVTGVNESVFVQQDGTGHAIYGQHFVRAEHQLGQAAVGQGDSGGPVISYGSAYPRHGRTASLG